MGLGKTAPGPDGGNVYSGNTLAALEVPGYTRLRLISEGGMGRVYHARDPGLERDVALKVIRPEKLSSELRARFLTEARAVAALDHPHIVQVYEVGEAPGPGRGINVEGLKFIRVLRVGNVAPDLLGPGGAEDRRRDEKTEDDEEAERSLPLVEKGETLRLN